MERFRVLFMGQVTGLDSIFTSYQELEALGMN